MYSWKKCPFDACVFENILVSALYAYISTHNCWCACRSRTNGGIMLESSARERHESSYMMLILFSGMLIRDIEMIPLHALTGCGMRVPAESNLASTCTFFWAHAPRTMSRFCIRLWAGCGYRQSKLTRNWLMENILLKFSFHFWTVHN